MPTDLERLQTIKTNLLTRIAEVTSSPKPSYKTATGQQVDWNGYLRELRQQLTEIQAAISAENPTYAETQLVTPDDPLA